MGQMALPPGGYTVGAAHHPGLHLSISPEVLAHLAGKKHAEPDEDDK